VRIASRVSELSRFGCYLDMMNPFPTGTMVLVEDCRGRRVLRSQSEDRLFAAEYGGGSGFLEVAPASQEALGRWLDEAEKEHKRQSD